ncbi:hypothetical protein HHK36_030383 [Tetracentron sinense]|uniref:COBRA-like protein n=1 Tax=Tetracentron sinense TaxID=13715 RepID=A0A834YC10_TETSI|nr:hypothetical protein HHK36_030383 [Tetracentron sinense]
MWVSLEPRDRGVIHVNPDGSFENERGVALEAMAGCRTGRSVMVSIFNLQQYRHVDRPGWKLGWEWRGDEAIWRMTGAEATEQGNCSWFRGAELPHSCEKMPVITDLLPGAPYHLQVSDCCKGGVLFSMMQNPLWNKASFKMEIMKAPLHNNTKLMIPKNFSIGLPGYTCGSPFEVAPSKYRAGGARRWMQAFLSWNITCIYSQLRAFRHPTCCVSLSAFYSETIVECSRCSCGCQGVGAKCVNPGDSPSTLLFPHNDEDIVPPAVACSQHMCPIRVHWHVKLSYKDYWRVKVTVTNLNFVKNYTSWNIVVQHPNLQSVVQVINLQYKSLNLYDTINDTGVFWGIPFYNDILLQSGEDGNVQAEILLKKDREMFTFKEGWTFPRRIYFNGDECVLPPPEIYPRIPQHNQSSSFSLYYIFLPLIAFTICLLYIRAYVLNQNIIRPTPD